MSGAPVVIAGGGIAGLSAALAIARSSRAVVLFEREAQRTDEGAGLQLSPNASRHLRSWGVLDAIEGKALAPDRVVVRRGRDATTLANLDLYDAEKRYGAPFRVAHRADLHAALFATARVQPTVSINTGRAVTGWRDEATGLRVETTDGAIDAAALIIADGVRSSLREQKAIGRPLPLIDSGRVAWRALVPADQCASFARQLATNLWLGPDAHLVHYPLRSGSVVNLVAIVADDNSASIDGSWSRVGDPVHIQRRFAGWHADVRDLIAHADGWRVWPLLSRGAPGQLASGRVALAGDAAHPMMPFLAQGAAHAIEDAAALGDAFAQNDDARTALTAYEQKRLTRTQQVVAVSERQAKIYHLRGPAAVARDFAMRTAGSAGMRAVAEWIWRA